MKGFWILATLLFIFSFTSCAKYADFQKKMNALTIESIDIKSVKDGIYEGTCDLDLVSATVQVEVQQGVIKSVNILKQKHGPDMGAEEIALSIVDKQSVIVDAKTGATNSSRIIMKAVETALKKGL